MPIHDWTRVEAGIFHAFHVGWTGVLQETLNDGLLPQPYYVLAEQVAGSIGPDVLTLQSGNGNGASHNPGPVASGGGGAATLVKAPRTRFTATLEVDPYLTRRRSLVIRHTSGDRIVALIEIISPGNKSSQYPFDTLLDKAVGALQHGIHLMFIDLFPPTPRDPRGLHSAIWEALGGQPFVAPEGEPLMVASYYAEQRPTAFLEPAAVGRAMPDAPLFLAPDLFITVPLEATYARAWRGVPFPVRNALERGGGEPCG